jgi:hypothetical protein
VTITIDHDEDDARYGNDDVEMAQDGVGEGSGGGLAVSLVIERLVEAKLSKCRDAPS